MLGLSEVRMKTRVLLFAVVYTVVAAQSGTGLYELSIVHFNDFHAHFDEISPDGAVCNPEEAPCIGGFARLYTAIQQSIEAAPESIVLNGGDTFQGTIWYNFLRWNVSQHFMNMLPLDAHVLGNHEFDHGIEGLVPYLERLQAPMLAANVNATLEPELAQYLKGHVVIERLNRKIGVIGVLYKDFSAPGNVIMDYEVEAVNREAAILTEKGVNIIVLLTHVGFDNDLQLARLVSREVDIIVGAHSHTFLYTGEPPSADTAVGDYPTVVAREDGHKIPVVQASCYTRYLGNIKLLIDKAGVVQSWEGQPIYLGPAIVQDPQILQELEPWRSEVDAVGKEVLGTTLVALDNSGCFSRECNLGNWACDVFLEEAMGRAEAGAWGGAHACLAGAGGLRARISPGNITTQVLLMAMPFENYIQIFDLKGEYLLEALELSVGVEFTTPEAFSSWRMMQVGGIRVVYNLTQPIGSRVSAASVRCIQCDVPVYEPLDTGAIYKVLTSDYTGNGGDGYTMLSENRFNLETLELDRDMLRRNLQRKGSVFKDLDGRIQILH